jgi:hypothetical protein
MIDGGSFVVARFESLGLNIDLDGDTCAADANGTRKEVDGVAHVDRAFELDAVDGDGNPSTLPVSSGLKVCSLVDVGEDDAAEDRAVGIRVAGHGHDAECELVVGKVGGDRLRRGGRFGLVVWSLHADGAYAWILLRMIDPKMAKPVRESLAKLPHAELVLRLKAGIENFDVRVTKLSDSDLDTAFREDVGVGRWPIRVLLGHLADAELAFVHRMRRVVAEENPILQPWDENAFIDRQLYGAPERGAQFPIGAFLGTIHTLRQWLGVWLPTLGADDWQRVGLHVERGPQSVRTILEYDVFHLEHHAWFLNAKVARLAEAGGAE